MPWRADLHISSGASEVYVGPLLIDLAAYALLAFVLVQIWRRVPAFGGRVLNTVGGALIWLSGIGLFALIAWIMSVLDTFYEPWYDHQIWGRVISSAWGAGV